MGCCGSKIILDEHANADIPIFYPDFTQAHVLRIVDGDTIWASARLHPTMPLQQFNIRIDKFNAWETRSKNDEEKKQGLLAKNALEQILLHRNIRVVVIHKKESFGRVLADVFVELNGEEINVANWMIEKGFGHPYTGGKKKNFTP